MMRKLVGTLVRWLPSPFLKWAFGLHLGLLALVLWQPALWPLALAGLVGLHLVLSTVGLVPRGTLLGPNVTRLPAASARRREVAITIDDGPDPAVTPAVLEILERHSVTATFFLRRRSRRSGAGARAGDRPPRALDREPQCHAPLSLFAFRSAAPRVGDR